MLNQQISQLHNETQTLSQPLNLLLIPKHPNHHKNLIIHIPPPPAGQQPPLFPANLYTI
ncbi:PCRF domain-containing protein, partial [Bacillus subtilis]|uniref:PCRF domain-containing protein n=1 Tax=Bacillus subtilis TaxID=1423 RepID=UPI003312FEEC